MQMHKPTFYLFAGNNGSGKSTIRNLLMDKISIDINDGKDFSVETTLAGGNALRQIVKAKGNGYEITIFMHFQRSMGIMKMN